MAGLRRLVLASLCLGLLFGCDDDDEDFCEGLALCDELDAFRCAAGGVEVEICLENRDGCPIWMLLDECGERQHCDDDEGQCLCDDECDGGGGAFCEGDTLVECVEDEDGCYFEREEDCASDDERCVEEGESAACLGLCQNECDAVGLSRCATGSELIETCEEAVDGCLVWVAGEDCAERSLFCDDSSGSAECAAACEDDCEVVGESRCAVESEQIEICELSEAGCREWQEGDDCAALEPTQVCDDSGDEALCQLGCESECESEGATRCSAASEEVETCSLDGTDGCLYWVVTSDCATEHDYCDEGDDGATCLDCDHRCAVEGEIRCAPYTEEIETCTVDLHGCRGWVAGDDCATTSEECGSADGVVGCFTPTAAGTCADPILMRGRHFAVSGRDLTNDFTDDLVLTGTDCITRDGGQSEVVIAVDLLPGETVRVRELGPIDVAVSVLGSCDGAARCRVSEDGSEVAGNDFTAVLAETVYVIVESWYLAPFSVAWDIRVDIIDSEICDNGLDDDADGFTDCGDDECQELDACDESLHCADGIDNDADGDTDCADDECFGAGGVCDPELICDDGGDQDGDTAIDCDDRDCASAPPCLPIQQIGEDFDSGDIMDLEGISVVFTPDATAEMGYTFTALEGLTDYPETPGDGTVSLLLPLGDSDFGEHPLYFMGHFDFFGERYGSVFVGSNGMITFGEGYSFSTSNLSGLASRPTIALFANDLDPSVGTVLVDEYPDHLVITYEVPRHTESAPNRMQAVLRNDGSIELHYLELAADTAVVGISSGVGLLPTPPEVDLYRPPPEECSGGLDEDLDGLVDCDDEDCFGAAGLCEEELNCRDGADNDDDGVIDCADEDCAGSMPCEPYLCVAEDFDSGDIMDLQGHSIVFSPDAAAAMGYSYVVSDGLTSYPVEPTTGTVTNSFSLGDSTYGAHPLSVLGVFEFYGVTYSTVYVGSNGIVTFDEGYRWVVNDLDALVDRPLIAFFADDLDPRDGNVTVDEWPDRLVLTFEAPHYGSSDINRMQVIFNVDGSIELHYLEIYEQTAVVGIASGVGVEPLPAEVDFITPPAEVCDDGIDNDFDLLTDCEDDECFGAGGVCDPETVCGDGEDNDADGTTDCFDVDCQRSSACVAIINEVRYDMAGTENAEFVELFGPAWFELDGYSLVHFNGTDGAELWAIDLGGQSLDNLGFFVIGGSGTSWVDVNWADFAISDEEALQNAEESIALIWHYGLADEMVVDALEYEADGTGPGEGDFAAGIVESFWNNTIGRYPDGVDSDDNATDFPASWWPTPGWNNTAVQPAGYARLTASSQGDQTLPMAIPDGDLTGLDFTATGPDWLGETIADVQVGVRIAHSWREDLWIVLTSPSGTSVTLWGDDGGSDDDVATIFDLVQDVNTGSMNDFNGEDPRGVWTLHVHDDTSFDSGEMLEWVLWIDDGV